jgi:hypothetical protein
LYYGCPTGQVKKSEVPKCAGMTDKSIATLILSMSLNFIKAWRNDKYNKIVFIWHFTLVLIKINYGQIGDQTGLFHTTKMFISL